MTASLCKRGVTQPLSSAPLALRTVVPTEAGALANPRRMLYRWTRAQACLYGQGHVYDTSAAAFLASGPSQSSQVDLNIERRLRTEYTPAQIEQLVGRMAGLPAPDPVDPIDPGTGSGDAGLDEGKKTDAQADASPGLFDQLLGEDAVVSPLALGIGALVVVLTIAGVLIFVRSR